MRIKTLKEFIVAHAEDLGDLFKFSAEHTCRSMLHRLEKFTDMKLLGLFHFLFLEILSIQSFSMLLMSIIISKFRQ